MSQTYEEWKKGFDKYVLDKIAIDLSKFPNIPEYRQWYDRGTTYTKALYLMTK